MSNLTEKFDHRVKMLEPHIVNFLTEIDEIKGRLRSDLKLTPAAIIGLKQSVIVTSAGASTRIEGAKLPDQAVERLMRGLSVSKFSSRDTAEVQGYLETLGNVFDGYETLPFRESTITALHGQLLKYSVKDDTHRGHYKKKENTVGILGEGGAVDEIIFQTTKAFLTPKEMSELAHWTSSALEKKRFHPLLVSANFIVEFLKIHPFEDGNGRLSRILTNLLLLQNGYRFTGYVSHEQIIERRKDEYYLSLRKSQETFGTKADSIMPWLNFFLSVVKEQANQAVILIGEGRFEDELSPKQAVVWEYVSKTGEATPQAVTAKTDLALGTVRQALNSLVRLGKIKRVGRGRATRYVKL